MSGCSLSAKDKMDAFPEESSNCVSSAVRKACETVDSSTSPPQRQQDGGRSSSDSFHSATSNSSLEFEVSRTSQQRNTDTMFVQARSYVFVREDRIHAINIEFRGSARIYRPIST